MVMKKVLNLDCMLGAQFKVAKAMNDLKSHCSNERRKKTADVSTLELSTTAKVAQTVEQIREMRTRTTPSD